MNRSSLARRLAAAALCCSCLCPIAARASAWPASEPLAVRHHGEPGLIFDFFVDPPGFYAPGEIIAFSLRGEPGARAAARIEDANGSIALALRETRPGLYEARYRLRPEDDFERPRFSASLSKRGWSATALASPEPGPGLHAEPLPACPSCGVVESSQMIEPRAGARARSEAEHLLTVRLDSGGVSRFWFSERPRFYPGQRVRLEGSRLVLD